MRYNKPVLLVEDDRVDAMTVERAFKDLRITNRLDIVTNGEEALSFLRNPANPSPCIILLDLNMPIMNGAEFMEIVKQDDKLKRIPVVILTTSKTEQDKVVNFDLGVAGYMIKPVDYHKFVEVIRAIKLYWTVSELPGENSCGE